MKNKKILCVDFDETLCYNAYPDILKAKRAWIHKLILWYCKRLQKKGWHVILNTCRKDSKLWEAKTYLFNNFEFLVDQVNENPLWLVAIHSDTRKIACDISIDNTNYGLIGWLLRRYIK